MRETGPCCAILKVSDIFFNYSQVTYEFVPSIGGFTNYTSSVDIFGVNYHVILPDTTDINDNEAVGIEIAEKALAAANAA